MARMRQLHAIVSSNLSFNFQSHNFSLGQPQKFRSFSIGKLYHLTYWSTKNLRQPHLLVSNKIQNIIQHHFEINKGLSFGYAVLFLAYCRPNWKVPWINNKFSNVISFSLCKSIWPYFLKKSFCISPYLMSFRVGRYALCYDTLHILIQIHEKKSYIEFFIILFAFIVIFV